MATDRCPKCAKEITAGENASAPFCSERCRLVDLDRWLSGSYRIPGPPVDPEAPLPQGEDDPKAKH